MPMPDDTDPFYKLLGTRDQVLTEQQMTALIRFCETNNLWPVSNRVWSSAGIHPVYVVLSTKNPEDVLGWYPEPAPGTGGEWQVIPYAKVPWIAAYGPRLATPEQIRRTASGYLLELAGTSNN